MNIKKEKYNFYISIVDGLNIVLLPLVYSLILGIALYLAKPIKWIDNK